jgi:hypothetical protein
MPSFDLRQSEKPETISMFLVLRGKNSKTKAKETIL